MISYFNYDIIGLVVMYYIWRMDDMASNEYIKLLVSAHFDSDERFKTVALQIAASEAAKGHSNVARDIKKIIDQKSSLKNKIISDSTDLILTSAPRVRISNLVLNDETLERLNRIILEYKQKDKIRKYGLENRRKILLCGKPGTGKTMTASMLATELNLPLYTIMLDKMMSKYMGETATKLRNIFDTIKDFPGVYLFDEFDAIGTERTRDNDIGEIRRVLNTFLQLLEQDNSNSIIIAATNNSQELDYALFRRFDDIIEYCLPNVIEIEKLISSKLATVKTNMDIHELAPKCERLSHAEIAKVCNDFMKISILNTDLCNSDTFGKLVAERLNFCRK